MVYNALAGGLLTGKHERGKPPAKGTRFDRQRNYRDRYWHTPFFDAIAALRGIAADADLKLTELAFRWLLGQPDVTCIILGASSLDQLEENLAACRGELSEEVMKACQDVWEILRGPVPRYNR